VLRSIEPDAEIVVGCGAKIRLGICPGPFGPNESGLVLRHGEHERQEDSAAQHARGETALSIQKWAPRPDHPREHPILEL
jgi:hypothetical protein